MEVYIVIEGYNSSNLCLGSDPRDCISADRKKDEGHIELEGLGRTLCSGHTVAHDVKCSSGTVLDDLPKAKRDADGDPESRDPYALPVLLYKEGKLQPVVANRACVLARREPHAKSFAELGAVGDGRSCNGFRWCLQ